jgi:small basic protein (TIGR04137 family)
MSIDRSLRLKSSLERHRNVLSRAERVAFLVEQERWPDGRSPLHLPKVSHRKSKAGKKKVKAEGEAAEAAAAAPGAAPAAAPAAAAPAGKPAAGAKPAAPAAKPAGKPAK